MDKELKNDLVCAWNEAYEVLADMEDLTTEQIEEVLPTIKERLNNCLHWLGKYVSEEDVLVEL